jgi:MoaA/NifB/PqqE/SkfB family radical SAM enzyme
MSNTQQRIPAMAKLMHNKTMGKAFVGLTVSLLNAWIRQSDFKYKIKSKFSEDVFQRPVRRDGELMAIAMTKSIKRAFDRGVSPNVTAKIGSLLMNNLITVTKKRADLIKKRKMSVIPGFVTVSPTNVCNLRCKGCYAGENYEKHTLDYDLFDGAIKELKDTYNMRFFVISGGEPFAYRSQGKTILDICEKHSDCLFHIFTNGSMITDEVASRLEKLGNVVIAVSVEGFQKETEARRGPGMFEKIEKAMENMRNHGLIFGISVTPMKHNAELLLSDEFIKFWFDKQGATYAWYFQYMPMGMNPSPELLVTPEQRAEMWKKTWDYIKKGYFLGDFWNCGTVTKGCVSSSQRGGYFHVLWNGDITPCVFIPFKDKDPTLNNLYAIRENNKSINDALNAPLFNAIRDFQKEQKKNAKLGNKCACQGGNTYGCGNLMMPCPIRDNSEEFLKILKKTGAKPFDEGATQYRQLIEKGMMPEYNLACHQTMDPIWKENYLKKK